MPVNIRKMKSCIYVIISNVLKLFLNIRKMSNSIPIITPVNIKLKKVYNCTKQKPPI